MSDDKTRIGTAPASDQSGPNARPKDARTPLDPAVPRATAGTDSNGLYSHVNRKEGSGPVARPQTPVAQTIPAARPKSETAQKLAAINEQSGLHKLNALPAVTRKPLDTG